MPYANNQGQDQPVYHVGHSLFTDTFYRIQLSCKQARTVACILPISSFLVFCFPQKYLISISIASSVEVLVTCSSWHCNPVLLPYEHLPEKLSSGYMPTTKTQMNLYICSAWLGPLVYAIYSTDPLFLKHGHPKSWLLMHQLIWAFELCIGTQAIFLHGMANFANACKEKYILYNENSQLTFWFFLPGLKFFKRYQKISSFQSFFYKCMYLQTVLFCYRMSD